MDEAPRRRISALCSHLRPTDSPSPRRIFSDDGVYTSACSSDSSRGGGGDRVRESSSVNGVDEGCVFCRIVCGKSPAYRLYEDDLCLSILDINPLCRGHALLIPKFHFSSLYVTPPAVIAAMFSKIPFLSNAIMKATGCDSFNLLVNNGAAAGQVIFHTHIHLIPRKASDCLWASESLRRLSLQLDTEASQLAKCIRDQMSIASDDVIEMQNQGTSLTGASDDVREMQNQGTSLTGNYRE
ncbi:hypothetical protein Droror1_Dr00022131 [Drosera rotundifolia]